jgi:glycosyltransferase involved in cell wall biosynthesis
MVEGAAANWFCKPKMLDNITPVVLTYNEEPNIVRTLSRLRWAKYIVVVDSGSTDRTLALLRQFPNVRVFHRTFDTHANQWRYAVQDTQITTEWVLRLDADYQVSDALIAELAEVRPSVSVNGYRISFDYAVFSRKLISSLYPSNTILLRRGCFSVHDKGHTEGWQVEGEVEVLHNHVTHDDWKPTDRWLLGQARYMQLELEALDTRKSGLVRWLRLIPPVMPIAVLLYCLFGKGLIFNGRAGLFYALQRMVAEATLSLLILEKSLRSQSGCATPDRPHEPS